MEKYNAKKLLQNLPHNYYVIDLDKKEILQSNNTEIEPGEKKCFDILFGKSGPCGQSNGKCICEQMVEQNKNDDFIVENGKGANKRYYKASFNQLEKQLVIANYIDVTKEFSYKKEIKINAKRLERAEKLVDFGYWEFNIDDEMLISSKGAREVYGITERVLPFHEIKKIPLAQYREMLDKSLHDLIHNNKPYNVKFKIKRPSDDDIRIIHSIAEYRKDKKMVFGVINDITESKEAEEEISRTNNLLRTVIDLIPDSIYMKDSNYKKIIANKGDAEHCGVKDVDEIIGKSDYDLYPKEIADVYTEDDKKVIENGEEIINREEQLPGEEKNRWVLTTKIPLKNDNNEITGLVGIGRDITEFKEQESQLKLFHTIIEQSPLSIIITDRTGNIEYSNQGFTRITGYNKEEVIGRSPRILQSGKHDDAFFDRLWETILSGNNWHGEMQNKKKNGTLYWENALITPVMNENKEIKHFVSISENVTEKKQMIKDLETARDKAEESDRLKSIFLANMSHEIRTPLNGILGFSNVICSGTVEENDKLDYYGTLIDNCGERLVTVVDDIIDISMIQSNQLKIEKQNFNLNELLEEVFVLYKSQKPDKLNKIEFDVNLCESNCKKLYSDKNRIYQVLKNLLDNAFKFTESGFIKFGCSQSTKDEVILFVQDSGIGVEKGKQQLIFESFRQAEEGNLRRFDGSGLGLAIITGILELLGGKVWMESEFGKGSTFFVSLPRSENKKPKDFPNKSKQHAEPVNGKDMAQKRILSVEDDMASIEYLKSTVGLVGHELVNYMNASEAIDYLRKNKVDLVLMDVQLPGMNGYDATRKIKSEFPNLPVIIQTAYAMKGDKEKALDAGCDDYLTKPVNLKMLRDKIKKYVSSN